MTMEQLLLILVPVVTAGMASGLTYLATRRNTHRQEQVDVMTGYAQLCDDLRAMIDLNNAEIARLRQEIATLRAHVEAEREVWRREREALQMRITELETINARLEKQLVALQARANGKEQDGG